MRLLKIGYVVKPHGIKGVLTVNLTLGNIAAQHAEPGRKIYLEKSSDLCGPFEIISIQHHKNYLLVSTKEINSIEQAEKFCGYSVGAEAKKLPKGLYWIEDLVGCEVLSEKNETLGTVRDVVNAGPNTLYSVMTPDNWEFLVPAIKQFIKKIDIAGKKITINAIPGLVESE